MGSRVGVSALVQGATTARDLFVIRAARSPMLPLCSEKHPTILDHLFVSW